MGRRELEMMRDLGKDQFKVLGKIDPGFPDWRGDVIKHYSTGELNLAKLDFEEGKITRPEFLLRVRKERSINHFYYIIFLRLLYLLGP